jgi:hypothetical protein
LTLYELPSEIHLLGAQCRVYIGGEEKLVLFLQNMLWSYFVIFLFRGGSGNCLNLKENEGKKGLVNHDLSLKYKRRKIKVILIEEVFTVVFVLIFQLQQLEKFLTALKGFNKFPIPV